MVAELTLIVRYSANQKKKKRERERGEKKTIENRTLRIQLKFKIEVPANVAVQCAVCCVHGVHPMDPLW